jgi:L-threonylcarbamoyladenylate synthase
MILNALGATITLMNIISKMDQASFQLLARSLKSGHLVAFPTETVYGLGADAQNQSAVARIYKVKNRPKKHPLIVHVSSCNKMDQWAREIPDYARVLGDFFWPGPMSLVLKKAKTAKDFITGGQDFIAIRVPRNSLALNLLKEFENLGGLGIAAPSANRFGKVSPTTSDHVIDDLGKFLSVNDSILVGGVSLIGIESTIIDCTKKIPTILRPGAITSHMINVCLQQVTIDRKIELKRSNIKTSGNFLSHYAPSAKVILNGDPGIGDGFIALKRYKTPREAIRLASPENNSEYARILYSAFRLADSLEIHKIFVIPPKGNGIAVAINDRLLKAANSK